MSRILSSKVVEALEDDAELSPELTRMMKNARKASDFLKALARAPAASALPAGGA
jgi:hypothetical protein